MSDANVPPLSRPAELIGLSLTVIEIAVAGMFPLSVMVMGLAVESKVDPNGPTGVKVSEVQLSDEVVQPGALGDDTTTARVPAVIVWPLEVVAVKTA
jgi:hypothetical protein